MITKQLTDLILAIDGITSLTEDLELILNSIFDNILPINIKKYSYPSNKSLASWIDDL